MKILIIGGTVFLGRHLVTAATAAGHEVTIFNRGTHQLADQNQIERVIGDRNHNLNLVSEMAWDAIIDTCGMDPHVVTRSSNELNAVCSKYVFISSISAFANFEKAGMTEKDPAKLLPEGAEQDYGSRKAACEKVVNDAFGERALIIRPGLIVGRYDPTDRFTYWPHRIRQGGKVLAPGRAERRVQFIDVRDLSEWTIRLIEAQLHGTFCATGPGFNLAMKELLRQCKNESGSKAEIIWVSDQDLASADVTPWTELPLWIPETDSEYAGFMQIDCIKAQNKGLSYRTVAETVSDVLAWDATRPPLATLKAGLTPEKEQELLNRFASEEMSN